MKIKLNENYQRLEKNYLFSEIAKRVAAYTDGHPEKPIIRLGIGDVTLPLSQIVTEAMHKAVDEMADQTTFRGYAPEHGYDFIRNAVAKHYETFGVTLSVDEIFVGDGAKSDLGNLTDIFGDNPILIPDPVYPVYVDSNLMCGRQIHYLKGCAENGFLPMPEGLDDRSWLIYLCSPNNPTGAVYNRAQLNTWVEFANRTGSLIIFDSAYEAFIQGDEPHSVFEIPGARTCAIEVCSLSKTAGFTGTRCGWTIVPLELEADGIRPNDLWERRQATKFNGVAYVVQRGAEAALSPEGLAECHRSIDYYMENACLIAELLTEKGIEFTGGTSSPYIWLKCPGGMGSWEFFDHLLNNVQVVGTPGSGFGACGEGWFRLTAFGSHEATAEAVRRLREFL